MLLSISNKAEVMRQTKRNRLFFWLGVAGLLASMVTLIASAGNASLAGLVFILGYPFLILGLVLSKRGAFNNRRHGVGGYKIKSESDMIAETLEGVPPRYHLYNWVKLGDLGIEHLLVTPLGLMILMVKGQMGDIKAGHDHVRRKLGFANWFATLGEPGIGQPSQELAKQVKALRSWYEGQGYEIPVDGTIVFTNPRTKILAAEEMSFPVCHLHDLKQVVRGWETELNMSVSEQQEIEEQIIKGLPAAESDEARSLAQMPGFKRTAMLNAQKAVVPVMKSKEAAKVAVKEEAPKPRLTPEERERLRLERIRANEEKGRRPAPVNPMSPPEPGKRVGLDGRVREAKPAVAEKKPAKRRAEPLRKPPPGAFGDISALNGTAKKK